MPAPPIARDPWAWASLASLLVLVLHSLGAPLGEAVAEDFDFLRHMLLLGQRSLLDGGGSTAFWRPGAQQLYYLTFGRLILTHPRVTAMIHVMLLAACVLLLYRMLRRTWPGPWAAVAASFPLLSESARMLISWPSQFADLGSLLFALLALHEASRRRMVTSLLSLLGSLLCKEIGVVTAALIPMLPWIESRKERIRWALATGGLAFGWASVYVLVRNQAGLTLPHGLEDSLRTMEASLATRFAWAVANSLRAIVSLPAARAPWESVYGVMWLGLVIITLGCLTASVRARARRRLANPWQLWGLSWFAFSSAALATIYPLWAPYRSIFGSLGLGIAVTGLAGAAHPAILTALVVLRLVGFALSPGPPPDVAVDAPQTGAFIDFERLVRLQRLMTDIRSTLKTQFPTLPQGSRVGQNNLPRSAVYALGGDHALQVWYQDTTLRWVTFEEYNRDPDPKIKTIVQFQPNISPSSALVDPAAMRAMVRGMDRMLERNFSAALGEFAAAESLQSDPRARVFLATLISKRALCLMALGDREGAVREALRAIAQWPNTFDARYVMAGEAFERGQLSEAEARLDTLLSVLPGDTGAVNLRERVRAVRYKSHPSNSPVKVRNP